MQVNRCKRAGVAFLVVAISALLLLVFYSILRGRGESNLISMKRVAGTPEYLRAINEGWRTLYDLPQDSPARFALNEIGDRNTWRAFNLLRGEWPGTDNDREMAIELLTNLRNKINLGLAWPYKTPPMYRIPNCHTPPVVDGSIDGKEWGNALVFHGSYAVGDTQKIEDNSIWRVMWNQHYLFVSAFFPDKEVIAANPPYAGDALGIFIMPEKRMNKYWEIAIGCGGNSYTGFHCNNRYGGWVSDTGIEMKGLQYNIACNQTGMQIEAAIPFCELPNYMRGNIPENGQILNFALFRTVKPHNTSTVSYNTAFPLLYAGHNIFGHAIGTLVNDKVEP